MAINWFAITRAPLLNVATRRGARLLLDDIMSEPSSQLSISELSHQIKLWTTPIMRALLPKCKQNPDVMRKQFYSSAGSA
ncbi:hypothetical protein J6590_002970 [Homalodisca vitripennis]|nr:hypothetical protein J6590_002970 [Homalodisca vitripennis]